jgi:cellulose biosynthesis protein BcsQ
MLSNAIAIANGKGGVGKTSIAANVAGLAALSGWRVLLLDLDSQGNLGRDLGYFTADGADKGEALFSAVQAYFQGRQDSRGHLLADYLPSPLREVRSNLDVLPGGQYLEDLVAILNRQASRDLNAVRVLEAVLAPMASAYNLILFDCPPSRGLMQDAALASTHYLVIPTTFDDGSLDGLTLMAEATQEARERNPALDLLGIVLFDFATQATTVLEEVVQEITADLGDLEVPIWQPPIRTAPKAARQTRKFGLLAHEYELYAMGALNRPAAGAGDGREPLIDQAIADEVGLVPRVEAGRIRRPSSAAGTLAADYQSITTQLLAAFAEASERPAAGGGR